MDERLRALLDQIPEKPPRSKLEPHLDIIRELRRKGRTYTVAASTIHAFVRVRARRRQQQQQIELPPITAESAETEIARAAANSAEPMLSGNVKERIEALKRRPPPEKSRKPRFEYDESEPLQRVAPGGNISRDAKRPAASRCGYEFTVLYGGASTKAGRQPDGGLVESSRENIARCHACGWRIANRSITQKHPGIRGSVR